MLPGGRLALGVLALCATGCTRDPRPWECPLANAGDLVVSEIRGPQSGPDTYGQWIELYNATEEAMPLAGVIVRVRKLDGSGEARIVVRDHDLTVASRGYVVLGRAQEDDLPAHMDYGFAADFDGDLYTTARVEVWACDVLVDNLTYNNLPSMGTLSLDGNADPSATANDDPANFCTDSEPGTDSSQLGLPGSPGARNAPCP